MTVKNTGDNVVMQVDENANLTIGTSQISGSVTTHSITILDGASNGAVLKSNASGQGYWGTDKVNDADHNANNERQHLSYNASNGNLVIDNGNHTAGNGITIPGTVEWDYATPRTISVKFSGTTITGVYYKDGDVEGSHDPATAGTGWSSASTSDYQVVNADEESRGIRILQGLLNPTTTSDISALYVSVYYFDTLNTDDVKIAYVGPMAGKFLKVLNAEGDTIAESENGICPLDAQDSFHLMSQYQRGGANTQTTAIWVTIWGYILE